MGIGVGISLLSCILADIYVILFLLPVTQAAIFDLPLTLTSDSMYTSPAVLLDPENMGIGVGISLLS
jgi:hypothetical protein